MSNQSYEQLLQSHLAGQDIGVQGLTAHDHQRNLAALLPVLATKAGGSTAIWIGPQTLHSVNTASLQQQTGLSIQVRQGTGGWMILDARGTGRPAAAPPQPGVSQPGVSQPGVSQPGVSQPGVSQPGVSQPAPAPASVSQLDPGVSVSSMPGAPRPVPAMNTVSNPPGAGRRSFGTRLKNLRWRWIPLGALVMGAVAVAATYLLFDTSALDSVGGPSTQLRVMFGIACLGYLFGGFLIAILSPGKTIAEPLIAAVMAYSAQLVFIFTQFPYATDFMGVPTMGVVAVFNGVFAYGGSWIGETVTDKS